MTRPPPHSSPRPRHLWPWLFCFALLFTGAFLVWQIIRIPRDTTKAAAQGVALVVESIGQLLQVEPKIDTTGVVTFERPEAILELALLTSQSSVEAEFESSFLHSRKRLKSRALFDVKIGYDLRQPFTITADPHDPTRILIDLPPAQVLSLSLAHYDELEHRDGLWNKIQPTDREEQMRHLIALARERAIEAGLPNEARARFQADLQQLLGSEYKVQIRERTALPPAH